MYGFFSDLKYSARMFVKNPGFSLTAVAALALGIGATTAIFSVVNTVLLKPLHIPDPDRLVMLSVTGSEGSASQAEFVHWRNQSSVFTDVSAHLGGVINFTGGEAAEQWRYAQVSASIFHCFGIPILRGRTFTRTEELPHGPMVALIGQGLWERRFASDPEILGKTISLDGEPHTVIGIACDVPTMREYGPLADVYVPFQIALNARNQGHYFQVSARLKPGITLARATEQLSASAREYRAKFPTALGPKETFIAKPFREDLVGSDRPLLLVLLSAVSLVLLIACSNVANLLLLRAAGRRREIAIRLAIGASRGRMIRQLLTESVFLSVGSGALGLLLGYIGIRALLLVNTAGLALVGKDGTEVNLDWRVMGFSMVVSLVTGIVFGLFPAIDGSRLDLNSALKESGGRSGTGFAQNRARAGLVLSEVSLAIVLLVGAALLIRSFVALYAVDPGFETKNVVTLNVSLTGPRYSRAASVAETLRSGLERLRALPGVAAAGATCCLPLAQGTYDLNFDILGRPPHLPSSPDVGWATVSSGYFEAFKIPLRRGRTFSSRDGHNSSPVVVINERMANQYWKGSDPLGAQIAIGRGGGMEELKDEPVREIVGIVGDIRSEGLDANPRAVMYVPQAQLTDAENALFFRLLPIAWVVRTQGEPHRLIPAIQEQLRQATRLPVTDVALMDQVVWADTGRQRFNMLVMAIFGGAALVLAAIGIYGLMAHTVEQRRQEIGIRLALGAESSEVRNMVVRQGMSLVLAGVVVGIAAAWGLARSIESFLYGVSVRDPLVFFAVPIILSAVALLAVWVPANRASRINPLDSLRYE